MRSMLVDSKVHLASSERDQSVQNEWSLLHHASHLESDEEIIYRLAKSMLLLAKMSLPLCLPLPPLNRQ
jgi:hypothetical protein